jgi:hypothetical protein
MVSETVQPGTIDLLTQGEIRPLGLMPRASNYTFLAEVGGGDRTVLAVYKPREGESPLWDFPEGTLCNREVAAYLLAQALGWPSVPPTVLRNGPMGPGSLQLYMKTDPRQHYFTLREVCLDAFVPIATFDVLTNNADRKSGHCLLASDGRIYGIDNGLCFHVEPKLRTVIWEFGGEPVPEPLLRDVRRLVDAGLSCELVELLEAAEQRALLARARALLSRRRFPTDTSGHRYPWPLV